MKKPDQRGIRRIFFIGRQVGGSIQSLEFVQGCAQKDVIFPYAGRWVDDADYSSGLFEFSFGYVNHLNIF